MAKEEEMNDRISGDPDDLVEDDEMNPAEAGFAKGEEEAETSRKKDDEDELY